MPHVSGQEALSDSDYFSPIKIRVAHYFSFWNTQMKKHWWTCGLEIISRVLSWFREVFFAVVWNQEMWLCIYGSFCWAMFVLVNRCMLICATSLKWFIKKGFLLLLFKLHKHSFLLKFSYGCFITEKKMKAKKLRYLDLFSKTPYWTKDNDRWSDRTEN